MNHLEAMAQWAHLGRARAPFHLYVPAGSVDIARRLAAENHVNVAEIWSFHTIGDQTRFTLVHRAPVPERRAVPTAEKERRPAAPAAKVTPRKTVPGTVRPARPAAPGHKAPAHKTAASRAAPPSRRAAGGAKKTSAPGKTAPRGKRK